MTCSHMRRQRLRLKFKTVASGRNPMYSSRYACARTHWATLASRLLRMLLLRAPLTLKVLSLAGVGCGDAGVSALASALGSTSAVLVISLDLSDNHLTAASGAALATFSALEAATGGRACRAGRAGRRGGDPSNSLVTNANLQRSGSTMSAPAPRVRAGRALRSRDAALALASCQLCAVGRGGLPRWRRRWAARRSWSGSGRATSPGPRWPPPSPPPWTPRRLWRQLCRARDHGGERRCRTVRRGERGRGGRRRCGCHRLAEAWGAETTDVDRRAGGGGVASSLVARRRRCTVAPHPWRLRLPVVGGAPHQHVVARAAVCAELSLARALPAASRRRPGLVALLGSSQLPQLSELWIGGNGLGDDAAEERRHCGCPPARCAGCASATGSLGGAPRRCSGFARPSPARRRWWIRCGSRGASLEGNLGDDDCTALHELNRAAASAAVANGAVTDGLGGDGRLGGLGGGADLGHDGIGGGGPEEDHDGDEEGEGGGGGGGPDGADDVMAHLGSAGGQEPMGARLLPILLRLVLRDPSVTPPHRPPPQLAVGADGEPGAACPPAGSMAAEVQGRYRGRCGRAWSQTAGGTP